LQEKWQFCQEDQNRKKDRQNNENMIKSAIMVHYKMTEKAQGHFLPVQYSEQILPGTYEHEMQRLIDEKLDLGVFDRKYLDDLTGAAAIQPRILLKTILYCYKMGC
jgi:hypothetical protein